MPTITFEPPATGPQTVAVQDWLGIPRRVGSNTRDYAFVGRLCHDTLPCDLTLDPTKPETWARAVYEAGQEAEYDRWDLELDPHVGRPERPTTMHTGGETRQPPKFEPKACWLCHKKRASAFHGWNRTNGEWHCCVACEEQVYRQSESLIVNGVEYRPVPT